MKAFYSDVYPLPLPEGHRFPLEKYALLRGRVEAAGLFGPGEIAPGRLATDEELLRAHDPDYVERVKLGLLSEREVRRIGFPWSPQLVERARRSVGATLGAGFAAVVEGLGVNLAGGTHHAGPDWGQGFCIFNDSVIVARALQAAGKVDRVVVVDCDVHQGNGTAAICAGDPTIYTFSIHGAKNFPFEKAQSDLDIGLPDGTGDADYLAALGSGLRRALDEARAELVIYVAGADAFSGDRLGRLGLSKAGLAVRDRLVFEAVRGGGLPLVLVMGGGYGREVADTVDIHFETVRLAVEILG